MNKSRIVMMTASVGCGHDQAAEAIRQQLLVQQEHMQVEIIDFMNILHPSISQFIKNTYLKVIDMFPFWYHLLYKSTEKLNQKSKVKDLISHQYKKKIISLLNHSKPDLILFTNPFPSAMISYLKKRGKINTKTATVITDYTAHGVWLDPTIDCYFVGSEELREQLIERGIQKSKVFATGIPVSEKFNFVINKKHVISNLGLSSEIPTILIMGGGLGFGPIEEILDNLEQINQPMQLLVVAGKNQQLKDILEKRKLHSKHIMKVFGFCTNMHELMECSHLLISKPGGLTMTEAVNKRLPVLIFDPIPGQEVMNAQYLSKAGTAVFIKNLSDLQREVIRLLYDKPEEREKMIECCNRIRKPNATREITKHIMAQLKKQQKRKIPMLH